MGRSYGLPVKLGLQVDPRRIIARSSHTFTASLDFVGLPLKSATLASCLDSGTYCVTCPALLLTYKYILSHLQVEKQSGNHRILQLQPAAVSTYACHSANFSDARSAVEYGPSQALPAKQYQPSSRRSITVLETQLQSAPRTEYPAGVRSLKTTTGRPRLPHVRLRRLPESGH